MARQEHLALNRSRTRLPRHPRRPMYRGRRVPIRVAAVALGADLGEGIQANAWMQFKQA